MWITWENMVFISLKQAFAHLPFFYTKKKENDIKKALQEQFPFLVAISLSVTPYHITFFPSSSLEAQELLWYRQEIITFLSKQSIKKQIKIIQ